jgi:CheY-specific phosphatase CheX
VSAISFEEVMFTIMSATQETITTYMGLEMFAGKVERGIGPVHSDVVGIIGIGGDRVGYILFSANVPTARRVARTMLSVEEPSEDEMRDAIGELTNNIAGLFKNKFATEYGNVALGLPLVVSGSMRPIPGEQPMSGKETSVNLQFKGVTIPFRSMDATLSVRVMVLL